MLDSDTFAARLQECYDRLVLVASAVIGDRVQAEDIVQEAAMIAYRKRDQFTPDTSFVAWMVQIVRLTSFNYRRKRRERAADPAQMGQIPDPGSRLTFAMQGVSSDGRLRTDQSAFDDSVMQALQHVPETARVCLLLRVVRNLSYAEIADMLAIPTGTAMSHVHRAKEVMRERLREYR